MPNTFDFPAWYRRRGYSETSRSDKEACAAVLRVSYSHIGHLLRGDRKPGGTLVGMCEMIEQQAAPDR